MGFSDYDPTPDHDHTALPIGAHDGIGERFDPSDAWLHDKATEKQQLVALRAWFRARYWDPANDTPYQSSEGGYIWIGNGPHSPDEVLGDRFSGVVDARVVARVAQEMRDEVGDEWARISVGSDDYYDERFDLQVEAADTPLGKLRERIAQAAGLLLLDGDPSRLKLVRQMVFGASITSLESFLWETVSFWVSHDARVVRNLITKVPALRDQSLLLGTIFQRFDGLQTELQAYLQHLVWHRWDRVAPLFSLGLEIEVPGFKQFDAALIKRHDIVHRSGHDKSGQSIEITIEDIDHLNASILAFAQEIEQQLGRRVTLLAN